VGYCFTLSLASVPVAMKYSGSLILSPLKHLAKRLSVYSMVSNPGESQLVRQANEALAAAN
jgi:shikimate 5-dehydrogenase